MNLSDVIDLMNRSIKTKQDYIALLDEFDATDEITQQMLKYQREIDDEIKLIENMLKNCVGCSKLGCK